ncbi:cation:proton antiporter [Granulicella sibirica]|uniref:Na+/H+ antiporter NhaP n=1 Tax=Granulicella sibirica TaxID=2479048 RepID=A0A4V1L685_9BACT|nr:sodium:proton antiporter [Granulicella sibirica]RXH58384.1 Na+/H+ antiporter NhaP [Granulicella sibirica]
MSTFALLSIIVTVGALFSFVSYRFLRLPTTIGTMMLSLAAAAALIFAGHAAPSLHASAEHLVAGIDFNGVVLHGMLAFLLFAGALQLDLTRLSQERLPVTALAVGATAISTILVAALLHYALALIGIHLSAISCLLFGALISPTDPIAVLDVLHRAGATPQLEVQLAGESLFNDGFGAVVFLALLGASGTGKLPSPQVFGTLLALEAGGGILLGMVLGYLTYRIISLVNSYRVEVLLSLALCMGGYALADALHLSAPLEVVTAGLLIGGHTRGTVMSRETREHLERFWELIDEFMNIVLFLLLGLQLLVLPFARLYFIAGLIAIPVVLVARFASVGIVVRLIARVRRKVPHGIVVLTWGGLRGALAVALALALPTDTHGSRNLLLVATFVVVVFSILVQGLTLGPLITHLKEKPHQLAQPGKTAAR